MINGLFLIKVFVWRMVCFNFFGWDWWMKCKLIFVVFFINFNNLVFFFLFRFVFNLIFELKWFLIGCLVFFVMIKMFLIFDFNVFLMMNWIVGLFMIGNIFFVIVFVVGKNFVFNFVVGIIVFFIFIYICFFKKLLMRIYFFFFYYVIWFFLWLFWFFFVYIVFYRLFEWWVFWFLLFK